MVQSINISNLYLNNSLLNSLHDARAMSTVLLQLAWQIEKHFPRKLQLGIFCLKFYLRSSVTLKTQRHVHYSHTKDTVNMSYLS